MVTKIHKIRHLCNNLLYLRAFKIFSSFDSHERIIVTTQTVLRIHFIPPLTGRNHTAHLAERRFAGPDAYGWRQVDLFPASGDLYAGNRHRSISPYRSDERPGRRLIANGIPAATLNSMMPEEERHRVRQLCIQGKVKLLYISPKGSLANYTGSCPASTFR